MLALGRSACPLDGSVTGVATRIDEDTLGRGRRVTDRSEQSGLLGIGESEFEELTLSEELRWLRQRIGKFVKGGVYLLAGQPGIGKSTLAIQLAVDLARAGTRTLYVLTEQSKEELAQRARLITSNWTAADVAESLKKIGSSGNSVGDRVEIQASQWK